MQNPIQEFFEKPGIVSENLKTLTSSNYPRVGVRTIAPEKNCPPVRVRVWFRVSIKIRVGGSFPWGQLYFLLKLRTHFLLTNVFKRVFGGFLFCLDLELFAKIKKTWFLNTRVLHFY